MSKKPKRNNFSMICRTCMSTKSLIPIFDGQSSINYYSSVISMVCGVKIEKEDGLPQKLCTTCIKLIINTIEFRKQSQNVETMLLNIKNNKIIQKDKSNTNIIENSSSDDLSDDETLIKYVNKDRQHKLLTKLINLTTENNLNENSFIKKETKMNIHEKKYKKDINTEKKYIKIENKLQFNQISIKNDDQNDFLLIKKETDHITDNKRSYNHNYITANTYNNHTRTKQNNTEFHNNVIGYSHNDTETKINDSVYDHNDTKTYNETINDHDSRETSHNDSGYNHNETGANTNNSVYDDNESETHNEARDNQNNTETNFNDLGYNHNNTRTNTINSVYNYNEEENNYNGPKTCHNNSGYNQTGPNCNDKKHTINEIKTTPNEKKTTLLIEAPRNNRVSCKICYKDLSHRSLDVHMSKCHPDLDERKTKCDLCSSYVIKNRMKRHMALHGNRFLCVYCMKEQNNKETLKIHTESCVQRVKKRTDNNSAKELKECDICKKVMQKGSLRLHKRLKHSGLGPVCEHCGKKLSNKFRLSEHLRARHGYEKHKCNLCDFQTAFRVHLKNHERRHRGEKPYICEICGTKYHSQNQLIQHRYTHNINKDYKCDQCPSSFKTTVHLSVHKNTTHSTVPMCCNVCTRHFRCRHYLLKHMRNVHRITGVVAFDNQIK